MSRKGARKGPERIVCAAIRVSGGGVDPPRVYCHHRHHDVIAILTAHFGMLHERRQVRKLEEDQGFLTSQGRFVDREEALKLALAANQVVEGETHVTYELYSEDLY